MSLWKRTTPTTISRLHPYLSRSSESASQPPRPKYCAFRAKGAKQQGNRRQRQPTPPTMPKVARGFAATPRNSGRDKAPPQPRPSFSPTIRGRSRSRTRGLTFADTPQDERTPAARSAQRGFFHVRGRPRRLALRSCGGRPRPRCTPS